MASDERTSILIVDDDETFRARLARAFDERGWNAMQAGDAAEAAALARREAPECAVVDLKMTGESGLWLVGELLEIDPQTRVVMLTGYGSIATAIEAIKRGAKHYLTKPTGIEDILAALGGNNLGDVATATPSLARTEWEHIQRVLADCGDNVSEAARKLKIHRRSLQRKLQKRPPRA